MRLGTRVGFTLAPHSPLSIRPAKRAPRGHPDRRDYPDQPAHAVSRDYPASKDRLVLRVLKDHKVHRVNRDQSEPA